MRPTFAKLPEPYRSIYYNNVEFIEEYFRKNPTEINEIRTVKEFVGEDDEEDYEDDEKDYEDERKYKKLEFPPLMFACEVKAKLSTIKKLVELGADVNQEVNYETALSIAVETGNLELVKYLYGEKNANLIYGDGFSVLVDAIHMQKDAIVEYFISAGAARIPHPRASFDTPLGEAAVKGRIDYVKKLMDAGVVDDAGILKWALKYHHPDVVDLIMSYKRRTPLEYAHDIVDGIDWLFEDENEHEKAKEYRDRYRLLYLLGKVDKLCQE